MVKRQDDSRKGQAMKDIEQTLRECEERFRDLVAFTSEYFWEQDEQFRFTMITGSNVDSNGPRMKIMAGKTRWEIGGTPVGDGGSWENHKHHLAAHKSFADFRYSRRDPVAGPITLSTSGKPVFDPQGNFMGYRGITRDITKVIREERLLELSKKVHQILTGTDDLKQTLQTAMQAICNVEGWIAGQFWKVDAERDVLQFEVGWYAQTLFLPESRTVFSRGVGFAGWVWQNAQPLWIPDTSVDPRVFNPSLMKRMNWNAAFLMPVTSAGEIIGVLGFFAEKIHEPDPPLLQVMSLLGAEIGHFHQHSVMVAKLRESEDLFHSTVDLAAICIVHVGQDDRITKANQATCALLGYTEAELIGMTFRNFTHPDDKEVTTALRDQVWAGKIDFFRSEKRYLHKDGHAIWISISSSIKRDSAGNPKYAIVAFEDITARKQAEQAVQDSEERFRSLIELTSDGYWEKDTEYRFTRFDSKNEALQQSLRDRFIGKRSWETDMKMVDDLDWDRLKEAMDSRVSFRDIVSFTPLPDGSRRYTSISGQPIFDADGRFTGYRGLSRDVTPEKQAEERIRHLATHDRLTNLPNREMLSQLMNRAIQTSRRYRRRFAVMFIDLDGFKQINDTLGHKGGDELLIEVTERLQRILRASDVIARLGGDEFVVLVHEIQEENQVAVIANHILAAVRKPYVIQGKECAVSASIGICIYSSKSQDEQSMMKHADTAMYLAKERGKNNYQFYTGDVSSESILRLELEERLRHAIARNEFSLHYQAKVDFQTGGITGVEALLRWHNPELGAVPPAKFIPIAEQRGLMIAIGKWVLRTACAQLKSWQAQGLPPVCAAINLSQSQITDSGFVKDIESILKETGIGPEFLEMEITENMMMTNTELVVARLAAIKQMGIRIAIANFGTGYTSLAHLKTFNIDTIKVDKSFIHEMTSNRRDLAITEAIINLGRNMGLTVVAEGVESAEQQAILKQQACDQMQGYFFSKPVTPDEFAKMLSEHHPAPRS
jgi:diguanylate cyclase (GGDEF)-like protein/PAS domain S-box-containing protein